MYCLHAAISWFWPRLPCKSPLSCPAQGVFLYFVGKLLFHSSLIKAI